MLEMLEMLKTLKMIETILKDAKEKRCEEKRCEEKRCEKKDVKEKKEAKKKDGLIPLFISLLWLIVYRGRAVITLLHQKTLIMNILLSIN